MVFFPHNSMFLFFFTNFLLFSLFLLISQLFSHTFFFHKLATFYFSRKITTFSSLFRNLIPAIFKLFFSHIDDFILKKYTFFLWFYKFILLIGFNFFHKLTTVILKIMIFLSHILTTLFFVFFL